MPSNGRSVRDRALSAVPDQQQGMWDREIDDDRLTELLEDREAKRVTKLEAGGDYRDAHDKVKARLSEEDLQPGDVIRCGRFRIEVSPVAARSVAFDTEPTTRMNIKAAFDA